MNCYLKFSFPLFVFAASLLVLQCNKSEQVDPPFDIEVIQFMPDQVKPELYWNSLTDSLYCYEKIMDYFRDGFELYVKLSVAPDISEKLEIVMSYFNHILSPPVSFYSVQNGEVIYECENMYDLFVNVCEIPSHKILKERIYYMILRFKFEDCVMNDGFLGIRFPIHKNSDLGSDKKYEYIDSWERYPVYFSVKNGQISEKPIHYLPDVWPKEVYKYLENIN